MDPIIEIVEQPNECYNLPPLHKAQSSSNNCFLCGRNPGRFPSLKVTVDSKAIKPKIHVIGVPVSSDDGKTILPHLSLIGVNCSAHKMYQHEPVVNLNSTLSVTELKKISLAKNPSTGKQSKYPSLVALGRENDNILVNAALRKGFLISAFTDSTKSKLKPNLVDFHSCRIRFVVSFYDEVFQSESGSCGEDIIVNTCCTDSIYFDNKFNCKLDLINPQCLPFDMEMVCWIYVNGFPDHYFEIPRICVEFHLNDNNNNVILPATIIFLRKNLIVLKTPIVDNRRYTLNSISATVKLTLVDNTGERIPCNDFLNVTFKRYFDNCLLCQMREFIARPCLSHVDMEMPLFEGKAVSLEDALNYVKSERSC